MECWDFTVWIYRVDDEERRVGAVWVLCGCCVGGQFTYYNKCDVRFPKSSHTLSPGL